MKYLASILFFLICLSSPSQHIIVLGTAQDGGFPHIGCQNECLKAHRSPNAARYITSLALVDPENKVWWLFEATPDMDRQLQYFRDLTNKEYPYLPSGIFLTHAHIGHYTGLMFLGKEALGAQDIKVYALPKMIEFLQTNGPWDQLIKLNNIDPVSMEVGIPIQIGDSITVKGFTVPHRDEYSETAGFQIRGKSKGYLFIPDIDKWHKWDRDIAEILRQPEIDHAFLDATFYGKGELPNRPMSEIPHPLVSETMRLLSAEPLSLKQKIKFIHLNHTNPLLFDKQKSREVNKNGYGIAEQGKVY